MVVKAKLQHIFLELREHSPFTLAGAVLGMIFMLIFRNASYGVNHALFATFHPAHVVLSALVTTSMFKLHSQRKQLVTMLLVGYFGSIGVATLSDVIMPHFGAKVFGLDIPSEEQVHHNVTSNSKRTVTKEAEHHSDRIHFGFIEEWYIVNPAAFIGIFIAYFWPHTKFPHAGHILISTWATAAYLLMDMESALRFSNAASTFLTLFLSVWLPCCASDIIVPLLFVKSDVQLTGSCPICGKGGHIHT